MESSAALSNASRRDAELTEGLFNEEVYSNSGLYVGWNHPTTLLEPTRQHFQMFHPETQSAQRDYSRKKFFSNSGLYVGWNHPTTLLGGMTSQHFLPL